MQDTQDLEEILNAAAQLHQAGRLAEAEKLYREVLHEVPAAPRLIEKLAEICYEQDKLAEAIDFLRTACDLEPDNTLMLSTLSQLCYMDKQLPEAIKFLRMASSKDPDNPDFHFSLGAMLDENGYSKEADGHYRQAIRLKPNYSVAYSNLGNNCLKYLDFSAALDCFREALRIDNTNEKAHYGLANALMFLGQGLEADQSYRRQLAIAPHSEQTGFLLNLHNLPHLTDQEIFAEHTNWARMQTANIVPIGQKLLRPHNQAAPVRVGYVSADFCAHAVANFIIPVLQAHDRARVTCFCFSNVAHPDAATERMRQMLDHWHDISKLNDDQAAALIKEQQIDVLVDLSGHTSDNRLLVFARQPAPVQVTYLGYADTTGLAAMDYRITDDFADPPGVADQLHTEKLVRIAPCFLCYQPVEEAPATGNPPARQSGHVTFGSFNDLSKITADIIAIWSEILKRNPGSKLLLKTKGLGDKLGRELLYAAFAAHGIAPERIECKGLVKGTSNHLEWYNRVDIALDTFPYHGTTTTCETLWMGVPVVTLAGTRHAARVGVSILTCVGLEDCIAKTPEEYIAVASRLAGDIEALSELRRGLRPRMAASPLMDKVAFVAKLESAYEKMLQPTAQVDRL